MIAFLHESAVALLLAQIAIILIVSRAFGFIGRLFGQPLVVAEIVAGIALGPSLLGQISPQAVETIFPASSLPGLFATSQLGLVLFMFVVGLEFDLSLLQRRGRLALTISQWSIALPFGMGLLLALWLHPRFATDGVQFWPFALFMGASMSVTAFPVLARILSERGLLQTHTGALALTCAAANDVTAWCMLAFVIAVVRSGNPWDAVRTTIYAAIYVTAMIGLVRPFLKRVADRYGTTRGLSQTAVAAILLLLLVSAVTAEAIGVHALFGAFVYGAIMPRQGITVRVLTDKLEDLVVVLLLPLFFAFTGLRTTLGLVDTPELWAWCGVVCLVATAGKVFGTTIPGWLGGLSWRENAALGALMNTRGLMELIILNIGLDLGVLTPLLFTILVFMAVATTLITTPVVRLLYPPQRVLAERAAARVLTRGGVLTAISHPASAPGLARLTAALTEPGEPAFALCLLPIGDRASLFPETGPTEPPGDDDAARALSVEAKALGRKVEPQTLTSADPIEDICQVARLREVDVIVLGLHRPLIGTARLGGPLLSITQRSDRDVCMFYDNGFVRAKRVLVALGSSHDDGVRRIAARLAAGAAVVTEIAPGPGVDHVQRVLDASKDHDLVVVGVGPEWELPMTAFGLKVPRLVADLSCSLVAIFQADA